MYSPYRTYFHNVVAQKIGIPATLAALYIGCVDRLHAKGVIPDGESIDVLIRPKARSGIAGVTAPVAPWVSFWLFWLFWLFCFIWFIWLFRLSYVRAIGLTCFFLPQGVPSGTKRPANSVVCTHNMALRLQLAALKRAYWPWEWDDSRDSGVLLAVEAAAYADTNRMNTVR